MHSPFLARFWTPVDPHHIRCELCPRCCVLSRGQRGFCFVRQNIDGKMVLTTYGRSSGFCVDPIEKKPLYHFYPGSKVLSFGTAGCNLGCKFCQNWHISKSRDIEQLQDKASPAHIAQTALRHQCQSVAFTYNDPVIFMEYAVDTAQACHDVGIFTVAKTAGYICAKPCKEFLTNMDAVNVDLKAFSEKFYQRITLSSLKPVLETLMFIKNETSCWLEITNLLIPQENDSMPEIQQMCQWIVKYLGRDVPLHFTAFHPDFRMLHTLPTAIDSLRQARHVALSEGLRYVYIGNIHDEEGAVTTCPTCQEIVIYRHGFVVGDYRLNLKGRCPSCFTQIPGCFGQLPGRWESRPMPVRISP